MDEEQLVGTGVPVETVLDAAPKPQETEAEAALRRARESADRQRRRLLQKERDSAASLKHDSKIEATKAEALDILRQRVHNEHVVDTVYHLGVIAANKFGLATSKYFWHNGVQNSLISQEKKEAIPLEIDHDAEVLGEQIHRGDLYAIYDFGVFGLESVSFEDFLSTRSKCRGSAYELGVTLLERDFYECHRVWSEEFFPKFTPIKPGYSQKDMRLWLQAQTTHRDFLLLSSRNAFKTSFLAVWAVAAALNCPDLRILFVSETNKQSRGFIRGFRNYLQRGTCPERFGRYFPEFLVDPDDGSSLSYICPMRRLGLIASTAESTSADSSTVGTRADIAIWDDILSGQTTLTEEACQKTCDVYYQQHKLLEAGSGIGLVAGTPWRANIDLYAVLLEKNTDGAMKVRIDPAWTVKTQFKYMDVKQIREEHLEKLLFPERLDWAFLQRELRNDNTPNKSFFKSQNLVEWTPSEEDSWRVTFDRGVLDAHICSPGTFSEAEKVYTGMAVDIGYSTSRYADPTAIVVARILRWHGKYIIFVIDVKYERWKLSEVASEVVSMLQKWPEIDRVISEKTGSWDTLQEAISNVGRAQGVRIPHFYWKPVSSILTPGIPAKTSRIRSLEILLADDKLWFAPDSTWNDYLLGQLTAFDGIHKSSGTRKDDGADSLALLAEAFYVWPSGLAPNKSSEQLEEEKQMEAKALLDAQYKRIHGMAPGSQQWSGLSIESEPDYVNPLTATLQRFGMHKEN